MADITFVIAPIGGGKSLYGTRSVCKELQRTERKIVTNLPVNIKEAREGFITVGEWAHKYVTRPVDIQKRVRVLEFQEVFEFWRFLPEMTLDNIAQETAGRSPQLVPNLQSRQGDGGCLFVIDEVHLYFAARDWTSIGNRVEAYMSQLRKLNDDLMLITQHPEKVDKNFRRNATEWIYLENMGKKRLFGGVSLPKRFRYHIFSQMPLRNDKPSQSGWLRLEDEQFHQVYDTMAGVGLSGRLAPEGNKRKHRHWIWWLVIALALGGVGAALPNFLAWGSGRGVRSVIGQFQKGVTGIDTRLPASNGQSKPAVQNTAVSVPLPPSVPSAAVPAPVKKDEDVSMTGYMRLGDEWLVSLSDGRMLSSHDIRFERLTEEGVKYDGKYYTRAYFNRASVYQPRPASVPESPLNPAEKPARVSKEASEPEQPTAPPPVRMKIRVHTADGQTFYPGGGN